MRLKSLGIDYYGETIISDIDDCLMYSSMSLRLANINPKTFYFDDRFYDVNKYDVFTKAKLTAWGTELMELVHKESITDYRMITSAKDRLPILMEKFKVCDPARFMENMPDEKKIDYLNTLTDATIYVDDKHSVIARIKNGNVRCVAFPSPRTAPSINYNS